MNYDFSNFPIDLILNILNIVILFVIVRFLVYKPVKKFMDARTARVTAAAEDAGAKAKAAEELSEQLKAQLADAANDADRIRNEAAAAAKAQADNVLKEAGEQADRIVSEAKERAEAEREEVPRRSPERFLKERFPTRIRSGLPRSFFARLRAAVLQNE